MARASFLRQPSYPAKIDPSHPIGRKVTACISPHYGAPHVRPMEMIRGEPATIAAGAINGVAAGIGKAFRPNNTTSGVYWTADPRFCDGSKPFSVETLFTFQAADAQFSRLFDFGAASGVGTGGWDLETTAAGNGLLIVYWNGATPGNNVTAISGMVAGTTYHLVVTCPGNGSTTVNVYLNAVLTTSATTQPITTATNTIFSFNTYRTVGDLSCAGIALHLARFYQGYQLTPNEVARLYTRPFEMFRKPRRGVMKAPAAGGSFIPGWASGATKTIGAVF